MPEKKTINKIQATNNIERRWDILKRYFSLYQDTDAKSADIYIYGDITSYPWMENDVSSYNLSKELQELEDVEEINVYLNSYGGEVSEGLAIYNALKRHKAKVTTIADGFACSIASVIFAAGDERLMSDTSLLMIHNAWTIAGGDSQDLRKQADDLEKITQASINAYLAISNVEEDEIKEMMDVETWLGGSEALEMGFATGLVESEQKQVATQSIRDSLLQKVTQEPKEKVVAQINFDEEKMKVIVQEQMEKLEERMEVISKETNEVLGNLPEIEKALAQAKKEEENKPKNMLKAIFNNKEEQ